MTEEERRDEEFVKSHTTAMREANSRPLSPAPLLAPTTAPSPSVVAPTVPDVAPRVPDVVESTKPPQSNSQSD